MIPRGLGCGALVIMLFAAVLIGGFLFNMDLIGQQSGCPDRLRWGERTYMAVGPLGDRPHFDAPEAGAPVRMGTTLVGMTGRELYGPPGSRELPGDDERPAEISLDCGDGTYRSYRVES